jgi:hypothetical protein
MKCTFLLIFLSQLSFAQVYFRTEKRDCPALDLRTDQLKQIRNQKKLAWCYAFTAADMLTYSFDLPEKASAADIAINYNDSDIALFMRWLQQTFGRRPPQGELEVFMMPHQTGFNKIALERVMRDGFCPERIFPSEAWTKMTRDGGGWVESQVDLKTAMLDIYTLLKNQHLFTLSTIPFYYYFKNVETAYDFYKLIQGESITTFYSKLRKRACQFDRLKLHNSHQVLMSLKDVNAFRMINKQLNQGRIVGIDYDARILSNQNNTSIQISELHTSALVARRWSEESKECQYLVRDSHGNQCTLYDPNYECLGGQVWIDESKIYSNLVSFVYSINK